MRKQKKIDKKNCTFNLVLLLMDNSVSSIPQSEEDQEVLVTLAEALEAFTKDFMVQVSNSSVVEQ